MMEIPFLGINPIVAQFGQGVESLVDPSASGTVSIVLFWLLSVVCLLGAVGMFIAPDARTVGRFGAGATLGVAGLMGLAGSSYQGIVGLIAVSALTVLVGSLGTRRVQLSTVRVAQPPGKGGFISACIGVLAVAAVLGLGVATPFLGVDSSCLPSQEVIDAREALGSRAVPCRGITGVNAETIGGNVALVGQQLFAYYLWPAVLLCVALVLLGVSTMALVQANAMPNTLTAPEFDNEPQETTV